MFSEGEEMYLQGKPSGWCLVCTMLGVKLVTVLLEASTVTHTETVVSA